MLQPLYMNRGNAAGPVLVRLPRRGQRRRSARRASEKGRRRRGRSDAPPPAPAPSCLRVPPRRPCLVTRSSPGAWRWTASWAWRRASSSRRWSRARTCTAPTTRRPTTFRRGACSSTGSPTSAERERVFPLRQAHASRRRRVPGPSAAAEKRAPRPASARRRLLPDDRGQVRGDGDAGADRVGAERVHPVAYSADRIAETEVELLRLLDWRLTEFSALHFLGVFLHRGVLFADDRVQGARALPEGRPVHSAARGLLCRLRAAALPVRAVLVPGRGRGHHRGLAAGAAGGAGVAAQGPLEALTTRRSSPCKPCRDMLRAAYLARVSRRVVRRGRGGAGKRCRRRRRSHVQERAADLADGRAGIGRFA